jgi:hypothetical protein
MVQSHQTVTLRSFVKWATLLHVRQGDHSHNIPTRNRRLPERLPRHVALFLTVSLQGRCSIKTYLECTVSCIVH